VNSGCVSTTTTLASGGCPPRRCRSQAAFTERLYFARCNRLGAAVITAALVGPASELIGKVCIGSPVDEIATKKIICKETLGYLNGDGP
jgi:hypothetical protein